MKTANITSYLTLASPAQSETREKASKFLGFAFPVTSGEQIKAELEQLRKLHPKANHHCYAWRLGFDRQEYRAQDDGEPSGTAGKPILGQIDSFQLTEVLIVVVRYFGGTKLGTGGLIQAYRECAHKTLLEAEIITKSIKQELEIEFPYEFAGDVNHLIHQSEGERNDEAFADNIKLTISLPIDAIQSFVMKLKAIVGRITLDEATNKEEIAHLVIRIKE
ncbi:MAG: YigZ family protein [Saprospiraceae bacterium]